jgi:ParB family chromosome partitioning protein
VRRLLHFGWLTTVPAYIRIANDNESLVMALVENIQRHDLDPIEIALSYQRLIDEIQLTQEQMSERVGKSVLQLRIT